jgi:hypothetical protein
MRVCLTQPGNVEAVLELEGRGVDADLRRDLPGGRPPGEHDGEEDDEGEARRRQGKPAYRDGRRSALRRGSRWGGRGQRFSPGLLAQCLGLFQLKEKFAHGFIGGCGWYYPLP